MRPDPRVELWDGGGAGARRRADAAPARRALRGRPGAALAGGADGRGALLAGDIVQVVQDRRFVSFMYSYPNLIPLPGPTVRRIVAKLEPYAFDRIYGAWWGRVVRADAHDAVRRSAERYLRAIGA